MSESLGSKEEKVFNENGSAELYFVVKNQEDQYSIWPYYKRIPDGWEPIGEPKEKEACLNYIEEVWTDMRPLSLRKQMEEIQK